MKKGISALFALSLLFVMAASPAFAAVGLTIEGKSSVSRDITYYVLPKGGAPASVSTTIGGVSTTGFGSNAYDLFLSNGWQLNGKDSLSFNADISGKSFSISGPPAEGSLMLTLMSGMTAVPNLGNQLIWALENRIANHLITSLASSLDPLWYGYLGLAVVGLVIAVIKGVRKPA